MLTVASWNMNQRLQAWQRLRDLTRESGASIALMQEARRPANVEDDWRIYPPVGDTERWRTAVPRFYRAADGSQKPTRRYWASAGAATGGTSVRFRETMELCLVVDGGFACSHPGQFAVGDLDIEAGRRLTVISLYGIWDPMPGSRDRYVEASLHRAISDLSVVFQAPEADLILVAGDFNLYNYPVGDADRSQTVWSRLAAYGLEICGPPGDQPRLARCPCPDSACRHVNTYLHGPNPTNRPYQLDYFLATPPLRERLHRCPGPATAGLTGE